MSQDAFAQKTRELLALADVEVGGGRPWDLVVHDDAFHRRVLAGGSLALGESYMDGWWDCPQLDEFFHHILRAGLDRRVASPGWFLAALRARLVNLQARSRAYTVGERHYDLGNELYRTMLDTRMIYSCGYWDSATTLDEAQEAKVELVCRKLGLAPGMRVLDIGCGWGGTAKLAAERYGVEVVGVTVSRQQAELARELCAGHPVEIRLQDYREVDGTFDRVLSLGMFEHVGCRNYRTFFEAVRGRLRDDGLFLLHTIGGERSEIHGEPWTEKYVFPNSMLPSARQIAPALEGVFVLEDWQNFGADYDRTLQCWFQRFDAGWERLRHRYDDRFYRMWKYYLLSSAGSFRARRNQVWQLVLSPRGVPGGHRPPGAPADRFTSPTP
jgi:cyclopropane-fatty-acyl-phospholipid synthase